MVEYQVKYKVNGPRDILACLVLAQLILAKPAILKCCGFFIAPVVQLSANCWRYRHHLLLQVKYGGERGNYFEDKLTSIVRKYEDIIQQHRGWWCQPRCNFLCQFLSVWKSVSFTKFNEEPHFSQGNIR